jgi:hypothetical protein
MKIILIAFALLAQSVFAQDCAPMNLITEENSPFNKIPVYDQDGLSVCYAYAAAQLVDYQLVKNGSERSVHPLWAALKYAESAKQEKISSGITYNAIQQMIKDGNCRYDDIQSALGTWAEKAKVNEDDVMDLGERLAPKFKNLYETKKITDPTATLTAIEVETAITEAINDHKPWCSAGATWDALMPELRALSLLSSRKVLTDLVLPVCSKDLQKLDLPKLTYYRTDVDDEYASTLDKKLGSIKGPVSVTYCSKVLYEPEFVGVVRKTKTTAESYEGNCGGHESLIVGKKKIGDQCHFLLRNSWGNGFSSSTKNWKCLCKNRETGEMVDDCSNDTHNNGQFTVEGCWISGDRLSKNLFGMTSLEKAPPTKPQAKPVPKKK